MSLAPVQISSATSFGGSLSAAVSLTGVTAGNHILVIAMHIDAAGSSPSLSCSDSQGSYSADVDSSNGGGASRTTLFRLANATGGSHTITVTASSGLASNSSGEVIALEVPPVALDQSNTVGGNAAAISVAATATLSASGDLAIAALSHINLNAGGGTFPPTGGTGTYTALVSHLNKSDADYQILSSTAGVGANWGTLSFAGKYTALVAAYMSAAVAPPGMQCL